VYVGRYYFNRSQLCYTKYKVSVKEVEAYFSSTVGQDTKRGLRERKKNGYEFAFNNVPPVAYRVARWYIFDQKKQFG
jgi:hypothetical protein